MRYRNRGNEGRGGYDRSRERDPRWEEEIDTGRRGEGVFRRDYADPSGEHRTSSRYERGIGYRAGYGDVRRDDANRWGVTRVYDEYGPRAPYSEQWNRGPESYERPHGRDRHDRYAGRYGRPDERDRERNFRPEPWAGPPGDYDRWRDEDRPRYGREEEERGYRPYRDERSFRGAMDREYEPEPDDRDRGRYGWGSPWPDDENYGFGRQRNDRTNDSNFDNYRYGSGRWGGDRNW